MSPAANPRSLSCSALKAAFALAVSLPPVAADGAAAGGAACQVEAGSARWRELHDVERRLGQKPQKMSVKVPPNGKRGYFANGRGISRAPKP